MVDPQLRDTASVRDGERKPAAFVLSDMDVGDGLRVGAFAKPALRFGKNRVMRCPACRSENPDGHSFCDSCGAGLGIICLQCRHKNSPGARFCGGCGASLAGPDGERKYATVMFADIVGSTELISTLDAEQALDRLKPALETMCTTVARFGGTVIRITGDGVLVLFGAPRAQEGHALLACEAALAMQAEVPRMATGTSIRVGLHSGELIASVLASDPTREQAVHGLTVHIASRLQGVAAPGTICLSEDCYHQVRSYCDVRSLGSQSLKGIREALQAYTLVGLKPAVASRQFRGTTLSSFRGRDREFAALQRALRRTDDSETQVVGISGAPGTGKSRLCYEFAEWCRGRLIPILEVRAQIYGHATPLHPVLEFFRRWFEILPTDDAPAARRRIAERLLAISRTFEADLPLLYEFLGVADESEAPLRLQPKARHARLMEVVRHIVRYAGSALSVIIVDDLHWLDEASDEFITTLVESVASTRSMLVLNYRPSYVAPWMEWPQFSEITLAELNAEHTGALVKELVGAGAELDDVRQRIVARSAGNPFFAEELARSLTESPAERATGENLPATVEAVIGARIDRLGEGEKAVLQIGAIIGKEFPLAVLDEVVGPLAAPLDDVLRRLCDHGLIQEQGGGAGREFAFRHPLIQEVSYRTQLKSRRKALHASVAGAMESFYKGRLDEFSGLVAYHYEAAGELDVAAKYESRAARWVGSTHSAQAIKHWQKVRVLLQGDRSGTSQSLLIMACGQIAWHGWREGMAAATAKGFVDEALALARTRDDTMVPLLLFVDGRITISTGGPADIYVERVREALSLLRDRANAGRIATLNCALSQAYGWAGLLNDALDANTAALEGVTQVETFDHQFLGFSVEHWLMTLRGRILLRLGRFDEAERCLRALIDIEDSLSDPTVQFLPHYAYVDLAWCVGDAKLAQRHAARVTAIAEKHGSPYLRVFALAAAGIAESVNQDFTAALRSFGESLSFARAAKAAMEYEPEILASIAECHAHLGQSAAALEAAQETIALARMRSARLPECRAAITTAAALIADGSGTRRHEAATWLARAEDLIRVTGAKIYAPLLARERARLPALNV